jgi:hypothetical protein
MINMNDFLLQIILAQRSDDVEGWMQILVFIVLAAFWLIAGIIKAKANKTGVRDEQSHRKPTRKPPVHSKEAREQMLSRLQRPVSSTKDQRQQPRPAAQKPRMKFADLQAAVRKFAVEAEKAFQADTKQETTPEHKPILAEPKIKAESEEFTEPMDKTTKILQETSEASQSFETEYLSELLTDYSDPDQLRRAILHYEILGRPLSLRGPSEDSI